MNRRVLIVDDEVLVRIGIKHSVDWEKYGYSIIGEASDGDECLHIVEELSPDVIILDINMPRMNGIEVLMKLKKNRFKGKIIVLTCYEELDYARNAMKYGASDYVLKTAIQEDGLLNALKELEFDELPEAAHIAKNSDRTAEEKIVRLLEGYPVDLEDIVVKPYNLYCINIKIMHLSEILKRYKDKKPDFFHISLQSMIRQALAGQKECVFIQYKPDNVIIFISFSKISSIQECFLKIRQFTTHLSMVLSDYMALENKIGVSTPKYKREQIAEAYEEAVLAISEGMVDPERSIFYFEKDHRENKEEAMNRMEQEMESAVIARGYQEVLEKSEAYFESIRRNKGIGITNRIRFLSGLMRLIKSLERDTEDVGEMIEYVETLDELESIVYHQLHKFIAKEEDSDNNYLIKKAKKYLDEHFKQTVTLRNLAEYMELSESYTSRLFNRLTGMNITAYVNDLRVEEAKKLLLKSNKKIYEIASETGYASTTAFHIAFKKSTGVTPVEYRNKNC